MRDPLQRMREQRRRREDSETTFGLMMAGLAILFVAAITGAFLYARDNATMQSAAYLPPPVINSPGPLARTATAPSMREAGTTGSGSSQTLGAEMSRTPPPHGPREDEQRETPPR